jgi:hypothetical protein
MTGLRAEARNTSPRLRREVVERSEAGEGRFNGMKELVARIERSEMRGIGRGINPDFATLNPGYACFIAFARHGSRSVRSG